MASATLARAASFSSGATESSRSRKLMSAGTVGALARKRSFDPGEDMHERRGRLRERSDMARWYGPIGWSPKCAAGMSAPDRSTELLGRSARATAQVSRWSTRICSARTSGVSCSDSSRSNRAGSPPTKARQSGRPST